MSDFEIGFKCKINTDQDAYVLSDHGREVGRVPGYSVLTTHNGYQWSGSSTMTRDELEVFSAFLIDYLREN